MHRPRKRRVQGNGEQNHHDGRRCSFGHLDNLRRSVFIVSARFLRSVRGFLLRFINLNTALAPVPAFVPLLFGFPITDPR